MDKVDKVDKGPSFRRWLRTLTAILFHHSIPHSHSHSDSRSSFVPHDPSLHHPIPDPSLRCIPSLQTRCQSSSTNAHHTTLHYTTSHTLCVSFLPLEAASLEYHPRHCTTLRSTAFTRTTTPRDRTEPIYTATEDIGRRTTPNTLLQSTIALLTTNRAVPLLGSKGRKAV